VSINYISDVGGKTVYFGKSNTTLLPEIYNVIFFSLCNLRITLYTNILFHSVFSFLKISQKEMGFDSFLFFSFYCIEMKIEKKIKIRLEQKSRELLVSK